MNMSKSRDIQAKMHLNDKKSQSVFLSFKCILARNCEGTEQLHANKQQFIKFPRFFLPHTRRWQMHGTGSG